MEWSPHGEWLSPVTYFIPGSVYDISAFLVHCSLMGIWAVPAFGLFKPLLLDRGVHSSCVQ